MDRSSCSCASVHFLWSERCDKQSLRCQTCVKILSFQVVCTAQQLKTGWKGFAFAFIDRHFFSHLISSPLFLSFPLYLCPLKHTNCSFFLPLLSHFLLILDVLTLPGLLFPLTCGHLWQMPTGALPESPRFPTSVAAPHHPNALPRSLF